MSIAADVVKKVNRIHRRDGISVPDALATLLETYNHESRTYNGQTYARFPEDDSYLRAYEGSHGDDVIRVETTNRGRVDAYKIIRGIHAYCCRCGDEVWCESDGRPWPSLRFRVDGREVAVCGRCQTRIIEGFLADAGDEGP